MCKRNKQKDARRRKKVWNECDDHVIQRCLTSSGRLAETVLRDVNSLSFGALACRKLLYDGPLHKSRFRVRLHNRQETVFAPVCVRMVYGAKFVQTLRAWVRITVGAWLHVCLFIIFQLAGHKTSTDIVMGDTLQKAS